MADQKISQLNLANPVSGTELLPIVQSGATKKIALKNAATISCKTFTIDELQTMLTNALPTYGLDNYPVGTPIKITSGTTSFQFGDFEYMLTEVVSNGAHHSINPNVTLKYVNTVTFGNKFLKGFYDLANNSFNGLFKIVGLLNDTIPTPTLTILYDDFKGSYSITGSNGSYVINVSPAPVTMRARVEAIDFQNEPHIVNIQNTSGSLNLNVYNLIVQAPTVNALADTLIEIYIKYY